MRTSFVDALYEIAQRDSRVVLITGDLGFSVLEKFRDTLPLQYVNAGVAEQNMTSMAVGMALTGRIVFTYSIANFPTLRCLEQVRNDICYHDANVKVVAVGGGFAYGAAGSTHHATEELGVMRLMPNMTVVAPADPVEARAAAAALVAQSGPAYLRLGKAGEPTLHDPAKGPIDFRLGKAIRVRDGGDLTLISTGSMLKAALGAAKHVAEQGVEARVLSMHTLKPLDDEAVLAAARETGAILTLEQHSVIGGLGGAVAELLAESGATVRFKRIGVPSAFPSAVGSQDWLERKFGLDEKSIAAAALALLGR